MIGLNHGLSKSKAKEMEQTQFSFKKYDSVTTFDIMRKYLKTPKIFPAWASLKRRLRRFACLPCFNYTVGWVYQQWTSRNTHGPQCSYSTVLNEA